MNWIEFRLTDYFDTLSDKTAVSPEFDVSNSMGVLKVIVGKPVGWSTM